MCVTRAVLHRSFPSVPPEHSIPGLKPRLSSAHFSTLPHVQVLIKPVEGLGELVGCWVEGGEGGGGGGGVKGTNSSVAWCWFGISLVPCCTVTHTRLLAQS